MALAVTLGPTSVGWAQERPMIAGVITVASSFRANARAFGDAYSTGFAEGAITLGNNVESCASPGTVGELKAYLLYGADPGLTLMGALAVESNRRGC